VAISTKEVNEPIKIIENTVEFRQLDQYIEPAIEAKLAAIVERH